MRARIAVLLEGAGWWLAMALVWMCTITTFSFQELVTAALCALPAAAVAVWARGALGACGRVGFSALRPLRLVPRQLVTDTVQLLVAIRHAGRSEIRTVELPGDDMRRAIGGVTLSLVPATYVVDLDERGFRLHALSSRRSPLERSVSP